MGIDFRQSQGYRELYRRLGVPAEDIGCGEAAFVFQAPVVKLVNFLLVQRAEDPQVLAEIDRVARRRHSFSIKIAPKALSGSPEEAVWRKALAARGYAPDKAPAAPPKTVLIDLDLPEVELTVQMKQKTRYNLGLSQRRGVTTQVADGAMLTLDSQPVDDFYKVYSENCKRIHTPSVPRRYLELCIDVFLNDFLIILAHQPTGEASAVASFIVTGDTVTYMMNGSTEAGRHDFAPTQVVWQAMLEGKARGCRWLDFDGMYDERYPITKEWEGFGQFKEGFGGQVTTYMGSYRKWWPFLKR